MTASAVTLDTWVARSEGLAFATVGEEVVMLHLEKSAYYDIDAIGADIWSRIEGPTAVRDLCEALHQRYEVDFDTCANDVLAFLNDAHREGIIRVIRTATV